MWNAGCPKALRNGSAPRLVAATACTRTSLTEPDQSADKCQVTLTAPQAALPAGGGTGSLAIGFVLKGVALTTTYNPTFLGFSSMDMLLIALTCFGLALVLTARTWLRLNEPHLQALERRLGEEEAKRRAQEYEQRNGALAAVERGE